MYTEGERFAELRWRRREPSTQRIEEVHFIQSHTQFVLGILRAEIMSLWW